MATIQYVKLARDERLAAQLGRSAVRGATDNAVDYWLATVNRQPGRRKLQYTSDDVKVKVTAGYSRDYRQATTDVVIGDAADQENHYHLVILEDGRVITDEWRTNHT